MVSGDLEDQVVVVRGLIDHRDAVRALRRERQLLADLRDLRAAWPFDDQRCLVEVEERERAATDDRLRVVAIVRASAGVEPVTAGVVHGDDERGLLGGDRCGARPDCEEPECDEGERDEDRLAHSLLPPCADVDEPTHHTRAAARRPRGVSRSRVREKYAFGDGRGGLGAATRG